MFLKFNRFLHPFLYNLYLFAFFSGPPTLNMSKKYVFIPVTMKHSNPVETWLEHKLQLLSKT